MIPAAGFFQAAGVNPISWTAAAILGGLGIATVADALRPVMVMTRSGLVIRRLIGAGDLILSWPDIEEATAHSSVISITTRHLTSKKRAVYQLELSTRAAAVIERTYQRTLVSGMGS